MRFHCLGVQHTITSKEYVACAFTQKVLKFCSMMTLRGHTVIHYGHQDSDVECTEHVTVLTREQYNKVYGAHDFRSKLFKFDQDDEAYNEFNQNAIREINSRKQPGDWLLAFWGSGHEPICKGAGEGMRVCEPGIGYPYGYFAEYKIFESYAMYHSFTSIPRVAHCVGFDVWSKEAVIPNYFELGDFIEEVVPIKDRENYFLFVGRIGSAKGVDMAIRMTHALGIPLRIAGQNAEDGLKEVGMWPLPDHVTLVGHIGVDQKKHLMAHAKAVVCMSTFAEPFCGVHVEALMSGTPVITSDWGAMTEFNIHGVTGFRCRTLEHMIDAGKRIHEISPDVCRAWAVDNFSTERVATLYEAFFEGRMIPRHTPKNKKYAVWSEKKWALGRIGRAIQKYIPGVDFYDWSDLCDNRILWVEEKWRAYDYIISNTTLLNLNQLYGITPDEELLRRLVVIAHFPRFEGMNYFKETLEKRVDGPVYAGVSIETCDEMKKYGVQNAIWIPFGADTDLFPWTHKVSGPIKRLGIIGGKDRTNDWAAHEEYIKNKGLGMFAEICERGHFEPVYIHGLNHLPPRQLYENIDALICCSELEGGPLGIFEAASCGVPVLTRPVGNMKEVKGICLFDTAEDALAQLDTWNKNITVLREYTRTVTQEVRISWSMRTVLKKHLEPLLMKDVTYDSKQNEMTEHVRNIQKIIEASGERLEGNIFGWDKYDDYETGLFLNKRLNLFNFSKNAQTILEIGFNAGHSCLMYLLSNPNSTIHLFDIGTHAYTRPCFEYLNSTFPGRLQIVYGDSRVSLPAYEKKIFDLIHVDGGHEEQIVRSDILNIHHFASKDTIIISDDDDHPHIARLNRHFFTPEPSALPSRHQFVGRVKCM